MQNKKIKDLLVIIIFFGFSLLFYKDIVFVKDRLMSSLFSDIFFYSFPFDHVTFGYASGHKIYSWNPYIFLGQPLINHPGSPLFYPLNLIFFFLPLNLAFNYSFLLNTVFCGVAIYLYLRYLNQWRFSGLLAAVIFMFNGVALLHAYPGHLQLLQTLPWLALLFLFTEMCLRKKTFLPALLAGLALGIQFLAGNPQYFFYTAIAASGYFLFSAFFSYVQDKDKKQLKFYLSSYVVLILIGLGIAAIKLIPSLEFTSMSDRTATGLSFAAFWSFPPQNLITYFLPEFYGDILHVAYWGEAALWEMCGYLGILPLILSIIAVTCNRNRYTIFFAGLSVFALLGSLGGYLPLLFKIFYGLLPGFSKFRGHSKMIMLLAFSVSVLSAYGLNWVLSHKDTKGQERLKRAVWILGFICGPVILITVIFSLNSALALQALKQIAALPSGFVESGGLNIILFSLAKFSFFITASFFLLFLWMKKRLPLRVFQSLALILVLLDLWSFGAKYIVSEKTDRCYWDRGMVSFLKTQGQPHTYRVMSPHPEGPFPNKAMLDGLHSVDGYEAVFLKRYNELFSFCATESIDSLRNIKLLSLANMRFLVMPDTVRINNPVFIPVYHTNKAVVWQNLNCLPRAYIVHGARVIPENEERVSYILFNQEFDPANTVILEEPPALSIDAQGLPQQPGESVEFLKYSDDEITIKAVLNRQGYLVLSDFNYPGWKVEILNLDTSQKQTRIPLYANNIFRAVSLEPGKYSLRFVFDSPSFSLGLRITIVTLALGLISLILLVLKTR